MSMIENKTRLKLLQKERMTWTQFLSIATSFADNASCVHRDYPDENLAISSIHSLS